LGGECAFLLLEKGWLSFSSPSYTTMRRQRDMGTCQCQFFVWFIILFACRALMKSLFWIVNGLVSQFDNSPSTCSLQILWWKSTFIRSFHSSVLQLESTPPVQNALYSPLSWLNPKKTLMSVGRLGALSGKRGLTQCELKWPFLWMSDHFSEWVDGWIHFDIADLKGFLGNKFN
jgi:hypothetical protein